MSALKQSVIGGAIVLVALILNVLAPAETQTMPAQPKAFDHSNCQYPDRWSNPPDGCDNSDPAVPECIKGFDTKEGEERCIAEFVKSHQPAPALEPVQYEPEINVSEYQGK